MAQEGVTSGLLVSHKNNKDPWWPFAQFCKLCRMNEFLLDLYLFIFFSFMSSFLLSSLPFSSLGLESESHG